MNSGSEKIIACLIAPKSSRGANDIGHHCQRTGAADFLFPRYDALRIVTIDLLETTTCY